MRERQLQVDKPRRRKKRPRADAPGEVEIPAYTALQADQRLADRMLELIRITLYGFFIGGFSLLLFSTRLIPQPAGRGVATDFPLRLGHPLRTSSRTPPTSVIATVITATAGPTSEAITATPVPTIHSVSVLIEGNAACSCGPRRTIGLRRPVARRGLAGAR